MADTAKKARGAVTPAFMAQAGKGRPKGIPNKSTRLAKEAIAQAAEGLGGADRLVEWAKESPDNERVFWTSIYTKLIPVQTEISGPNGEAIRLEKVQSDADAFTRRLAASVAGSGTPSGTGQTQH